MTDMPTLEQVVSASFSRDVLVVCGPEAGLYLGGQVSADVTAMEIGDSSLSFLLEPRGRIETLFIISRIAADTFVADTEVGFGEAMTSSLERFKLRTRAEFTLGRWQMHSVRGPCVQSEPAVRAWATGSDESPATVTRPAHWPLAGGHDVLVGPQGASSAPQEGVQQVSAERFEALRMAYGLPVMGTEIQPGDIPNETGLVERAASFTKGCYRGQELVERIDSRTGGRRVVRRFRASGEITVGELLCDAQGAKTATVLSAARLGKSSVGFVRSASDAAAAAFTAAGEPVELAELS